MSGTGYPLRWPGASAGADVSRWQTDRVKRSSITVLEACVARLGVHRGALAAAYVAQAAIAAADLGHVPTVVEYSEYWSVTERTGWNHSERMTAGLGGDWRPVVAEIAEAVNELHSRSPRSVMRLPLPRVVAV